MGGAKAPSTTTTTQRQELPRWAQKYSKQILRRGAAAARAPYEQYTPQAAAPFASTAQQRVAGRTADSSQAVDLIRAAAQGQLSGDRAAASEYTRGVLSGAHGPTADQQSALEYTRGVLSGAQGQTADQLAALAQLRSTSSGQYLDPASNPWLRKTYEAGAAPLTESYRTGTAAQTDAAAAMGRAFGGSAYNERAAQNERDLGRTLGDLSTSIYGGNYQTERDRQLAATGQLYQTGETERASRARAASELYGAGESERTRRERASSELYGRGAGEQAERMAATEALYRAGEGERGIQQQGLDAQYAEWMRQQEWPLRQIDILGGALGQGLGRQGTTTTQQPYQGSQFNPYAAAGGAGLGLLGAYGGYKGWYGGG